MTRRNFTMGLLACGLASPFIATTTATFANEGKSITGFARVRLKLQGKSVQPDSVNFTGSGRIRYRINLNRTFRQFNEDRAYIPGLNKPTLSHVFKDSKAIGSVRLIGISIIVVPQVKLAHSYNSIHLANQDRSFLLGDELGGMVSDTDSSKIPGLANIPTIGTLFRTKSPIEGKHQLLILIKPSIVEF